VIRIGTRGSALALWQAEHVRGRLAALGYEAEIVPIVTSGDRSQEPRLAPLGGKGAFLKEIEEALLAKRVDLAVHSLKDVPTQPVDGLALCAMLERADPRDALVSRSGDPLCELPPRARVGTGSLRRQAQLRALRPDLELLAMRGNVDTRLAKLRAGACEAIVLAMAGLARLGLAAEASEVLDAGTILPAPGQGVITIECRAEDADMRARAAPLHDEASGRMVAAERSLLAGLGGDCNLPLAAYAEGRGGRLWLRGFVARPDGSGALRGEASGSEPEALGRTLAEDLLARGAGALLA
jgi:hydroxymethylbilane synthase